MNIIEINVKQNYFKETFILEVSEVYMPTFIRMISVGAEKEGVITFFQLEKLGNK